jgi:hypothetical protein
MTTNAEYNRRYRARLRANPDTERDAEIRENTRLRNIAYRARVRANPDAHAEMLKKHYARVRNKQAAKSDT